MAICLPGMPSSVKRAATSEIRVAPLVMTTNCTTIRIRNRITPITTDEPVTKDANASITLPAADTPPASALRMSRVVAMLSTRRSSVVASSTDGKTLNSSGRVMKMVVIRINAASAMLAAISRSMTTGGSGTTMTAMSPIAATGTAKLRYLSS